MKAFLFFKTWSLRFLQTSQRYLLIEKIELRFLYLYVKVIEVIPLW